MSQRELTIGFGPVGLAGWILVVLGLLGRKRLLTLAGVGAVVADVTVAELGGFKALNETRASERPQAGLSPSA